jgi:hypothetical protein
MFWIYAPRHIMASSLVCFSRVRIVFLRIWPLEALRKISIVFDIFYLARKLSQRLRMLRAQRWAAWINYTHVKILHLVASLSTSRQQVVFVLLVTSGQQVWNKLLTICNNLVDIIRLVTRLFQQIRYSHDIAVLLQPCVVKLVTFLFIMTVSDLLEQPCNKSDNAIKLATSC